MQFISFRVLSKRIKAILSMMKDKTVPKRKKLLIVLGIIYLFLPIDLIPPVLFPFGFLDDLVLWIWIIPQVITVRIWQCLECPVPAMIRLRPVHIRSM